MQLVANKKVGPVFNQDGLYYLYNLADDPFERRNVATRYPEVVEDMRNLIMDLTRDMRPAFLPNRQVILLRLHINC